MTNDDTPRIQFATTADGVRIAYTIVGEGPPLVITPGWVSHQELEWQSRLGEFHRRLARSHRVILFDGRGTGLSDRRVDDVSVGARLKDLEAVVDHLQLERFVLNGVSQWSPVAITYAALHPERVEKLILYAPVGEAFISASGERDALARALIELIRAEWGVGAKTTIGFVHPDADREEEQEGLAYLRQAGSGDVAARILEEAMFDVDVSEHLPGIQAPALVLHRRHDNAVPLESGRRVASLLPNARLVILEGDHHLEYYGDSESILSAMEDFLGVERQAPSVPAAGPTGPAKLSQSAMIARALSSAPVAILFTDIEGSTTMTNALGDEEAQELLRAHNEIVREALRRHGGSEVKHTGDGIMASFPSATGALGSAVAIQQALAERNVGGDDRPVNVRIGINVGEPVRERDDLFGTAVQLARRICDQAEPGQILVSNVVRELVAGKGFLFAEQGETALRGFEDPVRLFEVRWAE